MQKDYPNSSSNNFLMKREGRGLPLLRGSSKSLSFPRLRKDISALYFCPLITPLMLVPQRSWVSWDLVFFCFKFSSIVFVIFFFFLAELPSLWGLFRVSVFAKVSLLSWVWWLTSVISAPRKPRQEDFKFIVTFEQTWWVWGQPRSYSETLPKTQKSTQKKALVAFMISGRIKLLLYFL